MLHDENNRTMFSFFAKYDKLSSQGKTLEMMGD
jgi:hypothetical protein